MTYTNAMSAFWAARLSIPATVPVMATMNWHTHMPMAPNSNSGRRPHASTRYKPGKVEPTLTHEVISVIVKGLRIPELVKNCKKSSVS